ncbi:hypothetical protein LB566_29230 [Mesorhizobium sp. CA13]|uniref:hypothetical protein n=1 Tax=Mesorhizobium sp. CA13 TaxID=2876643 RepID=UPI001CC9314B|nr:hypothetical protein [Mesorhizobium sp. CA13]MBZ9857871.1 hypothetical protein [Mesorhizobium sp. CA13]
MRLIQFEAASSVPGLGHVADAKVQQIDGAPAFQAGFRHLGATGIDISQTSSWGEIFDRRLAAAGMSSLATVVRAQSVDQFVQAFSGTWQLVDTRYSNPPSSRAWIGCGA